MWSVPDSLCPRFTYGSWNYAPKTDLANEAFGALGKVGHYLESGKQYLGDFVFDKTGSANWATVAYMGPDLLMAALPYARAFRGAEGLKGVPNSASGMSDLVRTRSELRLLDTSDFTNAQKGILGETRASLVYQRAGYSELEARLPGNNGFDGVFVKYDVDGVSPLDIVINESKFTSTGRASLSNTSMGRQMSPEWIDANIQKMRFSDNPAVLDTARLLRNNSELIRVKANVLNDQGINRWNVLKLPE